MSRPGSRRAVAVMAAALCGGATTYLVVPPSWSARHPAAVAESATAPGVAPAAAPAPPAPAAPPAPTAFPPAVGVSDAAPAEAAEPAPPSRLVLDRLGIDVPVVGQGVDTAGQMALPEDPGVAGWYRFGPAPASSAGAVVVAAHVDSRERGIGPFARLSSARGGDQVLVEAGGQQWRYTVTDVVQVGKDTGDLARFFARDGAPRLHLVTCIGRYDPGSGYEANLVVVAERAERAGE